MLEKQSLSNQEDNRWREKFWESLWQLCSVVWYFPDAKRNVGTPEDNAVVENEDEQAQDTETSEGHTLATAALIFIIHIMML